MHPNHHNTAEIEIPRILSPAEILAFSREIDRWVFVTAQLLHEPTDFTTGGIDQTFSARL